MDPTFAQSKTLLAPSHAALQPRYRRLFSFGDLLDESIQLFRQHWVTYAQVSAIALLPPGLILIWGYGAGILNRSFNIAELQTGAFAQTTATTPAQTLAIAASGIFSGIFGLLWSAAVVVLTDAYLRGEVPGTARVYGRAVRCLPVLFLGVLVYALALVVFAGIAVGLFVVTLFGIVGSLVAVVGLIVWWLRPGARKTWLKWLIILTTPFGLPTYFGFQWALLFPAVVLEHRGPIAALKRSNQLVDRHWFRVSSILAVASVIVSVLLYAPAAIIDIPLTISDASRGQIGLNPAESAISSAVSLVMQILFASIGSIVYTLVFVDMRNRREGTDIVERVSLLEAAPTLTNE